MKHTKLCIAALCTTLCLAAPAALCEGAATDSEPKPCTHPNATTTVEKTNVRYTCMDARSHTVGYDEVTTVECPDCEAGDSVTTVYKQACEAHALKDGACTLCGYKEATPAEPKPTPKPTPKPKPAPVAPVAPIAPIAPEPTPAPAVAPAMPEVAQMLFDAVAIAELSGVDVSVRVSGTEALFTADEQLALESLAMRERLMITLNVAGLADVTAAALESMCATLSPEAQALDDALVARMLAMTDEEQAAFTALLDTYFPLGEAVVDGVSYPMITLDLAVIDDGQPRIQRYHFIQDENGAWRFHAYEVIAEEGEQAGEDVQNSFAG